MTRSSRRFDYILAAGFAVVAFVISPLGIELITGRPELSFRVNVISLTFTVFLLVIAAAVLAQGRLRRVFFYAIAWTFPLAALAGMEAVAVSIRLADVVAPLEDTSLLANKKPWPTHLLTDASYYTTPEGFVLYHPWQGDGIAFNALGLRTAMPTPKRPGEWRIAVTGGSAAWGWFVRDADTIPVRLQEILRRAGHNNVTVYNFGIGGATLKQELALLKHFRDAYALDQVLFYTGGNDAILSYIGSTNRRFGPWAGTTVSFELIKAAVRLQAMWSEPSPQMLQWLDEKVLPPALKNNTLRKGIADADAYCRASKLLCDFALQPMMFARKTHTGAEARMQKTLARVYPRIDVLTARMYRDALAAGPAGHVFDLSHIFDQTAQPFFLDHVHLNEAGNRIAAEQVAPIVSARLP
jgi:lysophospholipase L1-like esterase